MCAHTASIVWYLGYARHRCNPGRIGVRDWGEFLEDATAVDESEESDSSEKEASQGTTLMTEVSSPDKNSRVNSSQITTITSLPAEKDIQVKSVREREKPYETIITCGQIQYINMADSSHHYDVIGYRKEQGQEGRS
uniref:Uncharacterized protein n=1 Tax=Magallana gigas TaxID=29159 RepID=K1QAZ8_MAGGI